ncbi:hypothetical protein [Candidatus Methanoprimaticola sp. MG2]|uniref:hypothetical protein n=1 Tax=Candidatus Methanoprimaticola sp. MG2 TaxID=3228838 RepID=UPI0039C5CE78
MAIPIPTIDQFKDTTVMRCMRKIVDYLIEDVVPAINQSPSQDTKVSDVENSISADSKLTTTVTNSDGSKAVSSPVQLPESGGVELNITQTPDGITINNIQLQEATNAQDGLVTKEQVKAIEDNTAMGDALSKELINGIVLAEGATAGTIKATLEQEDGTTIVSNDFPIPSSTINFTRNQLKNTEDLINAFINCKTGDRFSLGTLISGSFKVYDLVGICVGKFSSNYNLFVVSGRATINDSLYDVVGLEANIPANRVVVKMAANDYNNLTILNTTVFTSMVSCFFLTQS